MVRLRPLASITDAMVKPSGALCRKMARKISQPSQLETTKPEPMATPSNSAWTLSPPEDRIAGVRGDEFVVVGFFAVVEVGVDGVLQQVHDAIAGHDEDGAEPRAQAQALRRHLQHRRGHQKARAQGHEVAQVALHAARAHQDQAAGNVGQRGQRGRGEWRA